MIGWCFRPCRWPGPPPSRSHQDISKLHFSRIRKRDFRRKLLSPLLSPDGAIFYLTFFSLPYNLSKKMENMAKAYPPVWARLYPS